MTEGEFLTSKGSLFHSTAAAYLKDLSPYVLSLVVGTFKSSNCHVEIVVPIVDQGLFTGRKKHSRYSSDSHQFGSMGALHLLHGGVESNHSYVQHTKSALI